MPVLSFRSAFVGRGRQSDEFHSAVNTSLECSAKWIIWISIPAVCEDHRLYHKNVGWEGPLEVLWSNLLLKAVLTSKLRTLPRPLVKWALKITKDGDCKASFKQLIPFSYEENFSRASWNFLYCNFWLLPPVLSWYTSGAGLAPQAPFRQQRTTVSSTLLQEEKSLFLHWTFPFWIYFLCCLWGPKLVLVFQVYPHDAE